MSKEPTTLAELFEHQADTLGDKPFLFHEDRVVSFSELNSETNRVAHALQDLGVRPGVGVAIMMPNSPEWLFVYFAVQKLGGYTVPVNVALKGAGLRYIIDHSDSSSWFAMSNTPRRCLLSRKTYPGFPTSSLHAVG